MSDTNPPTPDDQDLTAALDRLAERGRPRGAAAVWQAAADPRANRVAPLTWRQFTPSLVVAAAVALVLGLVAVFGNSDAGPGRSSLAEGGSDIPTVSIPAELAAESRLLGFGSCDALLAHFRAEASRVVTPYGIGGGMYYGNTDVFVADGAAASRADGGAPPTGAVPQSAGRLAETGGADAFSTTNVQEAGVDEPDIVKTDGDRIFIAHQGAEVVSVDADDGDVLARLPLGNVSNLLVVGDRLIAFGAAYDTNRPQPVATDARLAPSYFVPTQATVTVLDVSDRTSLRTVSTTTIDGNLISARLVDDVARIVLSSAPGAVYRDLTYPASGEPGAVNAALEHNRRVIAEAPLARWLPQMTTSNADDVAGPERQVAGCDDVYRPPAFSGLNSLSVVTLDPADPGAAKGASVLADGETVYSSATNLYVATTRWHDPSQPTPVAPAEVESLIHQFDISDDTVAAYRASGKVPGTLLNQFAMSEHEGALRVATTRLPGSTGVSRSQVTVLHRQDDVLAEVGSVGDLGVTEQIYAVRFIGAVGYVVTFRQTDPLYVIDLRDPTAPKVTGELKIPGYSAYLHPIREGRLLGVGQDATEEGRRLGTQVSIFDVRDPAEPLLVSRHSLGQGSSAAEYDHHAFLWWEPKSLAVIPVFDYRPDGSVFSGSVGLGVDGGTLAERGRIGGPNNGQSLRTLVIGDRLVTVGDLGITVTNLDTFAPITTTPLPTPTYQPRSGGLVID